MMPLNDLITLLGISVGFLGIFFAWLIRTFTRNCKYSSRVLLLFGTGAVLGYIDFFTPYPLVIKFGSIIVFLIAECFILYTAFERESISPIQVFYKVKEYK